ncbi:MAG: hypothetical protein WBW84_01400 [Acidobacteriaceae bacterium]
MRIGRFVSHVALLLHAKGLPANIAGAGSLQVLQGLVIKQTALLSFIDVFWSLAMLGVAGIVLTVVLAVGRPGATAAVPQVYQHY